MIALAENSRISVSSRHVVYLDVSKSGDMKTRQATQVWQRIDQLGVSILINEFEGHVDVRF